MALSANLAIGHLRVIAICAFMQSTGNARRLNWR